MSETETETPSVVNRTQNHGSEELGAWVSIAEEEAEIHSAPHQSQVKRVVPLIEHAVNGVPEENDETLVNLQMLGIKFLRLAHRLGETAQNLVVAQVLYKLGLAELHQGGSQNRVGAFSFDRASAMAEQVEATGKPLDLSCSIMVLGKSGVGKSATINSIFDQVKSSTDAFETGTNMVREVVGTVQGVKVRMIDTPGLLTCGLDQRQNVKILHSVKRFIKKNPPDIVLYIDRLDMQSQDFGLLCTITKILGPSIWSNAIAVLTHAACAPPEDHSSRTASSYQLFVAQRSFAVQRAICEAANDMKLMNPVTLVENHSACQTNEAGQRVLPNGLVWKPHLLLLSFAYKILAEANTILNLQSPPEKPFANSLNQLKILLSSLLNSKAEVTLPDEQFNDVDSMDVSDESDVEANYDELPPFKTLTRAQLAKLSKSQKNAYLDELEYREKLFMKKQLKDEKNLRKLMKNSSDELANHFCESDIIEDNLDSTSQWLVQRLVPGDVGYDAICVEKLFAIKKKTPLSLCVKARKDKKESSVEMEVSGSIKHGEGKVTTLSFESSDMQPIARSIGYAMEKQTAYTLRSDTRFHNFRHNKALLCLSVTRLDGGALTAGVKLEDSLKINKWLQLVMQGGAVTGRGDVVYAGSLNANLRAWDNPVARALSALGLSLVGCDGKLGITGNVQTQIPLGRSSNLVAHANFNNSKSGNVSIRLNSSENSQIALIGLVPVIRKIVHQYQQMVHG